MHKDQDVLDKAVALQKTLEDIAKQLEDFAKELKVKAAEIRNAG
jgi:hypothetical protein